MVTTQERYIWIHEEYKQIPGCAWWLVRSVDHKEVEMVPRDSERGQELIREIQLNALPGHTSTQSGRMAWGWYETI